MYALGVLLYVLLGGPNPAAGTSGSAAELIKVIVETDAPRLSDVAPNGKALRGDLDNIVAKALKKRPEERYASVTAFADDLRRYLQSRAGQRQARHAGLSDGQVRAAACARGGRSRRRRRRSSLAHRLSTPRGSRRSATGRGSRRTSRRR